MKIKIATQPNLAISSPIHQQAIQSGDEHFRRWQRNVIDEFKDLSEEEIKNRLRTTAFPYAVCCENFINDFNIATVVRNANAFNAQAVYYIGNKKIDRRGMCGVHNYTDINFLSTIDDFLSLKEKYVIIGLDNISGATSVVEHHWEPNTMMVFGSEEVGLTPAMQQMCEKLVFIEQFGSVRSLNVGTASGIIMHDFVSKFRHQ